MIGSRGFKLLLVVIVLMVAGRVMGEGGAVRDKVSEKDIEVRSPDGGIRFLFRCMKGVPEYDLHYEGLSLIEHSRLSLNFGDLPRSYPFGAFLKPGAPVVTEGTDDYRLVVGKTSEVHDRYRQAVIPLI